tara:strand:- start:397 stop:561 length:165 start_codon:yes stop_codon:yes gene_type:complete
LVLVVLNKVVVTEVQMELLQSLVQSQPLVAEAVEDGPLTISIMVELVVLVVVHL